MSMGNFPESSSQEILVGIILVGRLGVGPVTHRSASPAHEPTACRFATSGRCITIILIIIIILLSLLSLLSLLIVVIITIIMIIMIMCIYIYIYICLSAPTLFCNEWSLHNTPGFESPHNNPRRVPGGGLSCAPRGDGQFLNVVSLLKIEICMVICVLLFCFISLLYVQVFMLFCLRSRDPGCPDLVSGARLGADAGRF